MKKRNVTLLAVCLIGDGDRKRSLRSHRPGPRENISSDVNGISKLTARTVNHGTNCHENSHSHMNNIKQEGHHFSLSGIKQEPCNTHISRSVSLLSHYKFSVLQNFTFFHFYIIIEEISLFLTTRE
jgi:hypothetical protein